MPVLTHHTFGLDRCALACQRICNRQNTEPIPSRSPLDDNWHGMSDTYRSAIKKSRYPGPFTLT